MSIRLSNLVKVETKFVATEALQTILEENERAKELLHLEETLIQDNQHLINTTDIKEKAKITHRKEKAPKGESNFTKKAQNFRIEAGIRDGIRKYADDTNSHQSRLIEELLRAFLIREGYLNETC